MTKRLLIDASQAEETRVVVLDGNRLEDFDVETLSRRQLKGNIYLAKIVRVEPSLQAAFVEYGGNRHGFLAFGEIHPDYYQIPVADRQRLLAMQEEEARAEEDTDDDGDPVPTATQAAEETAAAADVEPSIDTPDAAQPLVTHTDVLHAEAQEPEVREPGATPDGDTAEQEFAPEPEPDVPVESFGADASPEAAEPARNQDSGDEPSEGSRIRQIAGDDMPTPETVGGEHETGEETRPSRQPSRFMRSYKIQEVIRRRQILLIQVVKEERGTKGAALTTYISLAGRYCVLMPNSPRGGGISRKITSATDRRRLKEVTAELDIPRGMGLIVRTAGAARPKAEIKRDGEYLLRLWDDIRERTMGSIAPALIHEEASLIKRAIRDVYSRDVDELMVDGQDGWRAARDYMRMLMPAHVQKVQLWPANAQPLFAHAQVEPLLDAMLGPVVQLRSGGYLVINQTEALVAVDVNSGRSTRERGIEETALRTNLEAAEEAARQLRLRDLAGLIVIDFIDMESKKHNAMVERRMADALKNDRARIQIGHISHFGLLELSRQRLRPSLAETSLTACVACGGSGHVRSTESAALHVLREIEEEGGRRRAAEIMVHLAGATALYILNNKRQRLSEIETRYGMTVCFAADESLLAAQTRIDRLRVATVQDAPALPPPEVQVMADEDAEPDTDDVAGDEEDPVMPQTRIEAGASAGETLAADAAADADHVPGETEGEQSRRRRRRRRRGGRREDAAVEAPPMAHDADQPEIVFGATSDDAPALVPGHDGAAEAAETAETEAADMSDVPTVPASGEAAEQEQVRAKRGRRGGRRRRKPGDESEQAPGSEPAADTFIPYTGPTPADPFTMAELDIFDAIDDAQQRPARAAQAPRAPVAPALPVAPATVADDEPVTLAAAPAEETTEPVFPLDTAPPIDSPVPEPPAAPLIQPILVGSADVVERKKGWWRR